MSTPLFANDAADQWISQNEGQLSVDVIESAMTITIRAAIAGVRMEDVDLYVSEDVVTIRGTRRLEQEEEIGSTYHFRECYWGGFSRTVVLPAHIRPELADALMKNGVLTITLPKATMETKIPIRFED